MTTPPTLRELARRKGKTLGEIGVPASMASKFNTGYLRPGPRAIAAMAAALDERPEVVAAACDACWAAAQSRAAAPTPPMSLPFSPTHPV